MVDLPNYRPSNVIALNAPKPGVTREEVSRPYTELASVLDKSGEALTETATSFAEQAGYRAVTRDEAGNINVERAPIIGPAAAAYSRAVKFGAVAQAEGEIRRQDIALRQQFRDDPEGYARAAETFRQDVIKKYTAAAGPEVGLTIGKHVDSTTTQTYRGLLNEKERLDLHRADSRIEAGIASARDDLVALARKGVTSGPEWDALNDKIKSLTAERVNNPRLAYPRERAEYDLQRLEGDLKANGFLYHVDQVYKNKEVDENGQPLGGAAAALEYSKKILTDESVKLTERQREHFYHLATSTVRANEALRRQDIHEVRMAEQELSMASATGLKVPPEHVDQIIDAYRKLGESGQAARVAAAFARKPLHDEWGKKPVANMTQDLQTLRAPVAVRTNNPGNQWMGEVARRFGATTSENVSARDQPAIFPDKVLGAAAMFGLLNTSGYSGKTVEQAIYRWSNGTNPAYPEFVEKTTGISRNTVITPEFLNSPQGIALAKAMARYEAGHQRGEYPLSDAEWMKAQRLAFNDAERQEYLRGVKDMPPSPAGSYWLIANRTRELNTTANRDWTAVMKEWNERGIRPANTTVDQIVDAARATNDDRLLDTIAFDMDRVNRVQSQGMQPLPVQQATLENLRSRSAAGELAPGQASMLRGLEQRYEAITKGLKDNPIGTAAVNFPNIIKPPPPLDFTNEATLRDGLVYRGRIAQFAAQNWQVPPVSALDKADIEQLSAILDRSDPAGKAKIFAALTSSLPEDVRNATLAKLGEKGPHAMVNAFAGALYPQNPDVSESIVRGQNAIKADERNNPEKEGEGKEAFRTALDKALPPGAFTLAGRTNPAGGYATMRAAVVARYADLSAQANDRSWSEKRLQQAVTDVTGGILRHNGGDLIAPKRGMTQTQFDDIMWGITDADLKGVTTLNGEPVTADYLRNSARLESIGEGQYLVNLSKSGTMYAVGNADAAVWGHQSAPFILDLRGRQPGRVPLGNFGERTPLYRPASTEF